jgi:hopene-associated glycosyltransferase HpnB
VTTLAILALLAWLYLALAHGGFWRDGVRLGKATPSAFPSVAIVVPARDEADGIAASIGSLLAQDYAGAFRIHLVDDNSTDATASIARALPGAERLVVIDGAKRPAGWAGKLWAVHQGVEAADADLVFLTDADIVHDPAHLSSLVAKLQSGGQDMVSEMVELRCESLPERALIPAFVYFFAMLYPFAWVNNGLRATAAAAGGTVLIRRTALSRIGGIAAISGELIDDVALATRVKRGGRIWLGHSQLARSVRPYPDWSDVWKMIARSAYVQLKLSPVVLIGSLLGLGLLFLVPPLTTLMGSVIGALAWIVMAITFWPTLKRFGLSPIWAPALPLIACFYMAATIGSALDHHRGPGVVWKNRAYKGNAAKGSVT